MKQCREGYRIIPRQSRRVNCGRSNLETLLIYSNCAKRMISLRNRGQLWHIVCIGCTKNFPTDDCFTLGLSVKGFRRWAARDTNPTGTFTRKMTILLFFFFAREIRKVFSRVLLRIIKRSKMLHTISFRRYRMTVGLEMQSASLD